MGVGGSLQSPSIKWATLTLAAVLELGCEHSFAEPKTSSDYAPRELALYIEARSNGWTTQFFVAPMDSHGIIPVGPADKLFIAEIGGQEKQFALDSRRQWLAQVGTKATTFQVILLHQSKRYVNTVELPEPFSLRAHWDTDATQRDASIRVFWTPATIPSEMTLSAEEGDRRYVMNATGTGLDATGTATIPHERLERPMYSNIRGRSSDEAVVEATRLGGKITHDPALAKYPSNAQLQQIRSVLVTPPPEVSRPPAEIAVEPPP